MKLTFNHNNHKEFSMIGNNGRVIDVILDSSTIFLAYKAENGYFKCTTYASEEWAEKYFEQALKLATEGGVLL